MKGYFFNRTFVILAILLVSNGLFIILFSSTKAPLHFPLSIVLYLLIFLGSILYYLIQSSHLSVAHKIRGLFFMILPSSIILYAADFFLPEKVILHDLVITTGFVIVPLAILIIVHILYTTLPHAPQSKPQTLTRTSNVLLLLYMICFLFVGLFGVSKQSLVDEPLWIFDRVERYTTNLVDIDLYNTRPSDKPGVPVSVASSVALLKYATPSDLKETITPDVLQDLLLWMRAPIVIVVATLIIPLFWVLRRLCGDTTAHLTTIFVVTSPLLIGMTRIINPDAFLWILMPLTMLFFILSLKTQNRKHIVIAGILFGTTLLTKYVANVFFVFFPMIIIMTAIFYKAQHTDTDISSYLRRSFQIFALFSAIAILTIIIFLPSTWVYPYHILGTTLLSQAFEPLWIPFVFIITLLYLDLFTFKTTVIERCVTLLARYEKILTYTISFFFTAALLLVLATALTHTLFDYQTALTSPKSAIKNVGHAATFFTGFYTLLFGAHILILIGALYGTCKVCHSHDVFKKTILYSILLFIPFYYLGAMFGNVASTLRYQIALYPLLFIVAAYGYASLLQSKHTRIIATLYIVLASSLLFSLIKVQPFYFSYANFLLPHGDILNVKDMGDGSYQAAQYLNALPHATELSIWADKSGVCAAFVGHCTTTVDVARIAREDLSFDYYVTSSGRENLTTRTARYKLRKKSAPADASHFERLYTEPFIPMHTIILGNNLANTITVFSQNDVDLQP